MHHVQMEHMKDRIQKILLSLLGVSFITVLVDVFLIEQLLFNIKRFALRKSKGNKPITILYLTDLHFKDHLTWNYRRLVDVIKKISPSVIFISGDSVDKDRDLEPLEKFLRLLPSSIPKVAILGNHEYEAEINFNHLREVYEKANCDLLINESKAYEIDGTRIMVTGLDDLPDEKDYLTVGRDDFAKAVKNTGKEKHHFVLAHRPKHYDLVRQQIKEINKTRPEEEQLNIYAVFAGHTHGGQIKLGNFIPHLPSHSGGYVQGWYKDKKPYLYLSKGFGTSTVPIRFWSRAEVTVFDYYV